MKVPDELITMTGTNLEALIEHEMVYSQQNEVKHAHHNFLGLS